MPRNYSSKVIEKQFGRIRNLPGSNYSERQSSKIPKCQLIVKLSGSFMLGNVSSATLIFLSTLEPELHEHKPQQHHNNREKERLKNPVEITSICLDIHNLTSKVC